MDHSRYGRRTATASPNINVRRKKAETDSLTGIQLNDRQMKLYAARKSGAAAGMKEQNHKLAPSPGRNYATKKYGGSSSSSATSSNMKSNSSMSKPQEKTTMQQPYLGREPTQTAETVQMTFSEDSASNAAYSNVSSSRSATSFSSRNEKANNFYGQRLQPKERKMYDDLGNTWKDSQSEASAASAVSAALSRASKASASSTKSSSNKSSISIGSMARLRHLNLQRGGKSSKSSKSSKNSSAGSTYSSSGSAYSASRSTASASNSVKMSSDSRSVVSAASKAPSAASSSLRRKLPLAKPMAKAVAKPVAKAVVIPVAKAVAKPVAKAVAMPVAKAVKKSAALRKQEKDELVNDIASAAAQSSISVTESRNNRLNLAAIDTKPEHSEKQDHACKPSALGTQKEKSKFLRKTMMQWAKPSTTSTTSALRSTTSSTSSKSSSRRLSFAPKKSIITTEYRSPKSTASGGISTKEMAIMRKVAERNRGKAKVVLTPTKKHRHAAGKMIRSTSSRMKKLLNSSSSSLNSSSCSLNDDENDDQDEQPHVETVTSIQSSTLYDDSGKNVNEDAISLIVEDEAKADVIRSTPHTNISSNSTLKQGEVDRRTPIVMEEDIDNGEGEENVIARNQDMRKKHKRGRSSIFKRRINNIGMAVMDDLIEENAELSSDEDQPDYEDESDSDDEVGENTNANSSEYQDPADVSLHPARSIKSQKYEEAPRNINSILEENKEFLITMRKGPLKMAKDIPGLDDSNPTRSGSYDEEVEEYKTFKKTLRAELSGTHSKLYDGFQAMFRQGESLIKPAKPLSVYPGSLDLKTKEAISSMSKYLNTEHDVECLLGSQIVKDSDVRNYVFQHTSKTPRNAAPTSECKSKDEYGSIRQAPSNDSIITGSEGSEYEVTLGQHSQKSESVASSNDSRYLPTNASKMTAKPGVGAKISTSIFKLPAGAVGGNGGTPYNKVKLKARNTSEKNKSESVVVPSSWTKVRLRPTVKTGVKNEDTTSTTSTSTDSPETLEFHRIVLRKTPTNSDATRKTFKPSLETAPSSLTDTSGTSKKPIDIDHAGDAPDQPIKLTESHKPENKLTPMSGTERKPIEVNDNQKGEEDNPIKVALSAGYEDNPIKLVPSAGYEENPIKLVPSIGYEENPIKLVPSKGEESINPIQLAPSIDLDLNEGSIMIALEKEVGAGKDVDIKVIVGLSGITKIQSIAGQESTKANVIWRLERSEVKSALLDMSSFHVKVIMSSDNDKDHKDLRFPTSAQCMQFANALHEMKNSSSDSSLSSIGENKVTVSNDEASVYVEQLSNDEQKVLDEFRQRKNNPAPSSLKLNGKDFAKDFLSKQLLSTNNGDGTKPMSVVDGGTPTSPVSEVSAVTSALPFDQAETAMKYELMLKTKVPKEAIKHKMKQDGIDPSIIAKVLGEEAPKTSPVAPSSAGSNLPPKEEEIASTYRKMLKMGIPPEAVAHKMKKDGIDQKIVSSVLGDSNSKDQTGTVTTASGPKLTIPEQAAARQYQKMLEMGVPKEAVEHKMKKDGVDANIVAFVLGLPASTPGKVPVPTKGKSSSSSLNSEEEATASMYRKMLKMNIPKNAVQHKMAMNGISEKIVAAVLGDKKNAANTTNNPKKGGFNKTGFHWNPIDDDVSIAGSVWSKAGSSVAAMELISKHVEQFQKKVAAKEVKKNTVGQGKKEMAKLVKLERAQNVAITLKAFKDCCEKGSYKQLSQIIEFIDPFGKIKGDRALFTKDLLPKPEEVKVIKAYTGGNEFLLPAELWFQQIVHIKRIERKVEVMRTMETFKMDAIVLGKSFQLLTDVCNQVMDSDRLPDLLDMVRQIGNRMNQGRGDDAAGFKLDFLPRLAKTKGSDKKTTALDLVILIFCTKQQREALMLSDDFPDIQEASRIQFSDLAIDVKKLKESISICKLEFENLKKEHLCSLKGKVPKSGFKIPKDTRSESALGGGPSLMDAIKARNRSEKGCSTALSAPVDGLSLMDQIKSRSGTVKGVSSPTVREVHSSIQKSNDEVRKSLSPRASLLASSSANSSDNVEFSIEASIRRLEKFVCEADYVILPKLESERIAAVEACKDLASFFCEGGGEKAVSKLLEIIAGFAANIDHSVRKYDEQQKILARKEAALKKKKNISSSAKSIVSKISTFKKKDKSIPTKSQHEHSTKTSLVPVEEGEKKSIVLMVNEMLKVAGDKEIDDFVAGKKLSNPSSRLKDIYEAEEARTKSDRGDILSAIEKRRSMSVNPVPDQALSDLRATLSVDSRDESESGAVKKMGRVAQRWSSRRDPPTNPPLDPSGSKLSRSLSKEIGEISSPVKESVNRRKSRVVNRWSSNLQSEIVEEEETAESEIDVEFEGKSRQSIINRWASKSPVSEASTRDLDDESDIGAFQDMINQRRQKALNRWSSKTK